MRRVSLLSVCSAEVWEGDVRDVGDGRVMAPHPEIPATIIRMPHFMERSFCKERTKSVGDHNAVRAMQLLMDSQKTDSQPVETVHIGGTEELSMRELAERLFRIAGWHPKALDIHDAPAGSGKRRLAKIEKLKKLTDWKPEISLDEGLRRSHEWYSARATERGDC